MPSALWLRRSYRRDGERVRVTVESYDPTTKRYRVTAHFPWGDAVRYVRAKNLEIKRK